MGHPLYTANLGFIIHTPYGSLNPIKAFPEHTLEWQHKKKTQIQ